MKDFRGKYASDRPVVERTARALESDYDDLPNRVTTSLTPVGHAADSRAEPRRSCAPAVRSRGLWPLRLVDLFPDVHAAVAGRRQPVAFEDERHGLEHGLELEAP